MNLEGFIDRLDDHGFAAAVMDDEMNRRRLFDGFDDDRHEHDFIEMRFYFIDSGKVSENPIGIFMRCHRARSISSLASG